MLKPNESTFNSHRLSKIGINQVMDKIENQRIIRDINSKSITMLEKLEMASVVKCLLKPWKELTLRLTF